MATTNTATPEKQLYGPGFMVALLLGTTLNPINSSIIATALVSIGTDFGVTAVQTALLVSALYLVSAVCQPLMGRLATRYGARAVFIAGLVLVAAGGVIGWVAPSIEWLVVSRAVLGLGTSAAYPTAMMMIQLRAVASQAPMPRRILSLLAAAGHITAAIGLPVGGLLIATFGWRAVFAINVPLGLIALVCTLLWVPREGLDDRDRHIPALKHLDPLGILLFGGMVTALLVFLNAMAHPQWWLAVVVVFFAVALVLWERRHASPFLDVRMLARNGALQRTYLRLMLTFAVMYGVLYGVSQWLEQGRGIEPGLVGMLMLPMSVLSATASLVIGRWKWVRPVLAGSSALIVAGAALLWAASASDSVLWPVLALAVFGISMGLGNVANQAMLYLKSSPGDVGTNSGFYRTASYIGGFVATGLIGAAFAGGADDAGLLTFAVVFVLLGATLVVLSLVDRGIPKSA